MDVRKFVKSYQVPSGKDWLIEKEDVVVKLIEEYLKSNPLEKLVMPQANIKGKIIDRLNKERYEQVIIDGVPQYQFKPNYPIINEVIEIIKNMDLSV